MSLSIRGLMDKKDVKLNLSNKVTTLNPNAAEFVPSSLRSTVGNGNTAEAARLDVTPSSGKTVLSRSESNVSSNSEDEVHKYWRRQLPEDITPDFKFMVEDESRGLGAFSFTGLSLQGDMETSKQSASAAGQILRSQQDTSRQGVNNNRLNEMLGYSGSSYAGNPSSATFLTPAANSWDKQFINGDQYFSHESDGHYHGGDFSSGFLNNLVGDHATAEDAAINPLEFLALQFPGFAAESLADVYYANGCDMNMTIEILTQLELQVDGDFSQNLSSKSLAGPSFNMLDFPAISIADAEDGLTKYTGEDLQQASSRFSSPSMSRGATGFASTVRKLASQDSGSWNYEKNGSTNSSVGGSRSSQLLAGSYEGRDNMFSGDKLRSFDAALAAPVWLEAGETVANLYPESREESHDFARLRDTCFEQARQAYLIGSKALAKELNLKGQLYTMKMKEAHGKARETSYRQRSPVATELQGYGRGYDHLIDLHDLHVNEAIHVLKHELSILRSTARSAGKRLQVMICVGTGHHTKGARTPTRHPVAVEQYLVEEGLHYTQLQPGLLRVLIY